MNQPVKSTRTVSKNATPNTHTPVGTPRRSKEDFDKALQESHGDYTGSAKKMNT